MPFNNCYSRRETVKRAIHFQNPGRVPLFYFNGDMRDTDIELVVCEDWAMGPEQDEVEWGFSWIIEPGEASPMGVPKFTLLDDWSKLDYYLENLLPDPDKPDRFRRLEHVDRSDKYLLGSTFLSGFTVMMMLRGFENLMVDMYEEPENLKRLADAVFGFENQLIIRMKEQGFDGVGLFDDWGTQRAPMISAELFREHFVPHYKKQFDLVHSLGMDVFFHTCGNVYPLLQDLIGAGVDMLNLGQLDLNQPDRLREEFKGKVCFCQPLNYQKTGLTGTREEIYEEGKYIYELLGDEKGGFIPEIFDYDGMGWQPKDIRNTQYQIEAFRRLL